MVVISLEATVPIKTPKIWYLNIKTREITKFRTVSKITKALVIKARNNPDLPKASNGLVLASDENEYQNLSKSYNELIKNNKVELEIKPEVKISNKAYQNQDYKALEKDRNERIDARAKEINWERTLRSKNSNLDTLV